MKGRDDRARVIAFAGKGGVGKTTLAALLLRFFIEEMKAVPVLAIDADPNSNLNELLGLPVTGTIGGAREQLKRDVPQGMTKDVWFEYKVNEAVVEGKGFDLIVMGRPEGAGCYCAANSLAKKYIDALKENYPFVVVDNEAGMEHMSRLVTQDVERLFVVSDPTPRGLMTARRLCDLIGELNLTIHGTSLIINRVRSGAEKEALRAAEARGLEADGIVHDDGDIRDGESMERPVFSLDPRSVALTDAYAIFSRIFNRKG